jgi:tetratricopeptide (TPR) repeat protein
MKKYILSILIILATIFMIYKYGVTRLFTPGAVQKVKGYSIEEMKKRAYESEKNKGDADKTGRLFFKLGVKYLGNKNWTPAVNSLKKAIGYGESGARVHHSLAMAYANRGNALSSKKDLNKALDHYTKSIEINPKLNDSIYGMGILLFYKLNKKEDGIINMKKIIDNDPIYYRARFALGRFYFETKKYKRSLDTYQELYAILETKKDSKVINSYKENCKNNISQLMQIIKK